MNNDAHSTLRNSSDDSTLVQRAQTGDLDAFGQLVRRYQGLVFGVAYHRVGNVEDARDIAQDVFLRAFTKFDQLRDPKNLGGWLRQIAVNECRAQGPRLFAAVPLDEVEAAVDEVSQTDDRLLLNAALRTIDEKSRLTVILHHLHAHSVAEIAAFLDEPATTIKSRLRNARAKLRREMETILEKNLNENTLPNDFADRILALLTAVKAGDEQATRALLETDPKLAATVDPESQMTALHIAAAAGDAPLVELLLAHGADPNALDKGDNASPLHHAAERNRLDIVKLLVEAGADVNWDLDLHQRGPLGWAITWNSEHLEVAEYLLSKGAKLDIFSAIALGRGDAIRGMVADEPALLRHRMSRFEYFRSAIEFATSIRRFDMADILVELGTDLTLADVAGLGRTDLVAHRLAEKPAPRVIDEALKAAVMANQIETAKQLLDAGGDPNFAPQRTSLLFDSIGKKDAEMSRLLIERGADLEFKDGYHNSTPLGWQVFFGKPEQTQLALDLGAQVGDHLIGLAESGARGDLRRFSETKSDGYRKTLEILKDHHP